MSLTTNLILARISDHELAQRRNLILARISDHELAQRRNLILARICATKDSRYPQIPPLR